LAKKTNISEEAEGLIHHIQLFNVDIKYEIDKLIPKIQKKELSDNEIIAQLLKIKIYTEKVIAISNLITGAGFNAKIDKQPINIPVFIDDYIKKYYEYHDKGALQLECVGSNIAFFKLISPLELSIILDNLISNAKKWKAQRIQFNITKNQDKNLIIDVYDDGLGVSNTLMDNPKQIFELGVTETNGAGIGLYYVKHLLTTMNAEISFIGNNFKLKGAYFQISFFNE
jgi:K+-sensing histidine kinase KdpD